MTISKVEENYIAASIGSVVFQNHPVSVNRNGWCAVT
jgi:hypothetical protein